MNHHATYDIINLTKKYACKVGLAFFLTTLTKFLKYSFYKKYIIVDHLNMYKFLHY